MSRSDLGSSIVLILFGAFVAYESWRMPRFESIGGTVQSAPGLVPFVLGMIIVLLGAIMLIRYLIHRDNLRPDLTVAEAAATPGVADDQSAYIESPMSGPVVASATAEDGPAPVANLPPPSNARMLWTLVFSTIFGVVLVGTIPFWLAVFAFVFVFIVWFERPAFKDAKTATTRVVIAGAIAGAAAFAIPYVFENIFLVNLP